MEDQFHSVGLADVEIVGDQRLEEGAGVARRVEDQGARHLDLAHGQLPPVARGAVVFGQRQRQPAHPALEEHPDGARAQPITDGLQRCGIRTAGKPIGQLGKPDPRLDGLTFDPLGR